MSTSSPTPALPGQPRPAVRAAVSVLVALHLAAVFLGPFAMPPATSELVTTTASVFRPYVDVMSLANGYKFFAPEPGPGHLVRYELTLADGTTEEGTFPNRDAHKPRLLYHRYFMMSEFLNTLGDPDAPNERLTRYANSYAQHLLNANDAKSVKLYLVRHWVPTMDEVRGGRKLTDKVLYLEKPLGTFTKDAS